MVELVGIHPEEVAAAAQKAVDAAGDQLRRKGSRTDPLGNTITTVRGKSAFHRVAETPRTERLLIETIRLDRYGRPLKPLERLDLPQTTTLDNVSHLVASGDKDAAAKLTSLAEDLAEARPLDPSTYQRASVLVFSRPHPKTRYGDPFRAVVGKIHYAGRRAWRKATLAV
jgi:hypothetical protein